jgi:hypothetical protein
MPTVIANCWKKGVGKDKVTEDKIKLIPIPEQKVKAMCDALGCNLKVNDLTALTVVQAETLVTYHLSEKDVTASMKNGKNLEPVIQKVTQKTIMMIPVKYLYRN